MRIVHQFQDEFGDSDDDECLSTRKKEDGFGDREGKDVCIIKQAPKDAALLACLSCAIHTIRVQ